MRAFAREEAQEVGAIIAETRIRRVSGTSELAITLRLGTLLRETAAAAQRMEDTGLPAVLLVPAPLRWLLSRFLRRSVPSLKVIANSEVPETRLIRVSAMIAPMA